MAVMIGDAAVTMLPVAEERVARPRLKKDKICRKAKNTGEKKPQHVFLTEGLSDIACPADDEKNYGGDKASYEA